MNCFKGAARPDGAVYARGRANMIGFMIFLRAAPYLQQRGERVP